MFDASDRYHETALQDPTVLIEAYPIVESPEFSALPGSEDDVLFDPGFVAPETRVAAVQLALGRAAVPLSEADAAAPDIVPQANRVAEAVLRRATGTRRSSAATACSRSATREPSPR